MILRRFARFSLAFERLYKERKLAFLAVLLVFGLLCATILAFVRYATVLKQGSALAWSGTDLYVETSASELHPATLYLITQLLGLPAERVSDLATLCQNAQGSRWGIWKAGEEIGFFVQDPLTPPASEDSGVPQHIVEFNGHQVLLVGGALPAPTGSWLHQAWLKYRFTRLQSQYQVALAMNEPSSWLLGGINESNHALQLRLSAKTGLLAYPLEHADLPAGALYLDYRADSAASMPLVLPPFAKLPTNWFLQPATLHLVSGNVQRLVANPYDSELSWVIRSQVNPEQAQKLLDQHLQQLTDAYPILEDRNLPDHTTISELKIDRDQFILPGQSTILADQPSGALTYPQGQLTYSYKDGVFEIRKGDPSDQTPTLAPFDCQVPKPTVLGYADQSSAEALLWKGIEFALNKNELALCLSLE